MKCSEEIGAMVHAFDNKRHKHRVRELAHEVAMMERIIELTRPQYRPAPKDIFKRMRDFQEALEKYDEVRSRRESELQALKGAK